jgi:hypothetical protein
MNACSFWFDQLGRFNWHECCVQHDIDYATLVPKAIADAHLGACVDHILPGMGALMWLGVTVFGGLWYLRALIRHVNR